MTGIIRLLAIGLALGAGCGTALADVVAVVSAKSPVTTLNQAQVMDIFLGRVNHFPDGSQAVPIDLAEGSSLRDEFYTKFSGKSAAQIRAHWSKIVFTGRGLPPLEAPSSAEVRKLLAQNRNAIGYIERTMVDDSVRVLLARQP